LESQFHRRDGDVGKERIARVRMKQIEAQKKLITHRLKSGTVRAPVTGTIHTSPWQNKIGGYVKKGEVLFSIQVAADTPEAAYDHFIELMKEGDSNGAKQMCHPDFFELYAGDFFLHFEKHSEAMKKIADYSIEPEAVSKNMAKLKVNWILQDGKRVRDTVTLRKQDERWMVCDPF